MFVVTACVYVRASERANSFIYDLSLDFLYVRNDSLEIRKGLHGKRLPASGLNSIPMMIEVYK